MSFRCVKKDPLDTLYVILTRTKIDSVNQNIDPADLEIDDYLYKIIPSDTHFGNSIIALFKKDTLLYGDGSIFLFNEELDQYELIDSAAGDSAVIPLVGESVEILAAEYTDKIPPYIDVSIENPDFIGGMLLSNTLKLSCSIEDNEGIKPDRLCIALGNDTLKEGDYTILKKDNPRSIPIRFSRFLKNGLYDIYISAFDLYNNEGVYRFSLKVANQFNILYIGNFPNPVRSGQTVIACELTQNAKNLEFKVYNANGKKIFNRSFSSVDAGRFTYTYDVSNLPNGTYFYKFEAVSEDDEKATSIIQKMSVLK